VKVTARILGIEYTEVDVTAIAASQKQVATADDK
jgi:hypothetical protein